MQVSAVSPAKNDAAALVAQPAASGLGVCTRYVSARQLVLLHLLGPIAGHKNEVLFYIEEDIARKAAVIVIATGCSALEVR